MISLYSADSPYTVYCKDCWFSDKWQAPVLNYNFNESFFQQYKTIMAKTPHLGFFVSHGENSDYCTYAVYYKNCYMCISGVVGENMMYCYWVNDSMDCLDCATSFKLEKCYECLDSKNLFSCLFCHDCENSSQLIFCRDCLGCSNCIGCVNLRHKNYYIFNQAVSESEFKKQKANILASRNTIKTFQKKFYKFSLKFPNLFNIIKESENCTGNYLYNSKNSFNCWDAINLENCRYCWNIPQGALDCQDCNYSPKTELCYNSMSITNGNRVFNSCASWDDSFCEYCFNCFFSKNLFGCVGLKHEENCILNKKYNQQDYLEIKNKIIRQLQKENIYGNFFPIEISPYAYNQTIAQDFFY